MNIRFITILSSIALVSVALSSGTTIPGSSTIGGSTSTPKQSSTSVSSSFTMSAITTANPPPSVSSTSIPTIIANTTIVTVKRTSSTSPVTSNSLINSTSNSSKTIPPQSINSNAVTTNPNSTTPSTAANTKTNNSTQQPARPRTTLNLVPSTPAKTPVPDTTTEETIETTVQCDCSKYLPTSTDSANKNTEPTTTPTSSQTTVEPQTSVAPQKTVEPQTNVASQTTSAPQITMTPQTTAVPLMSSTANTLSKTTTNTTTGKPTTTSTTTNSSIVIKTVPTTMVSAITTFPITGASITPKPATLQPTAAPPTTAPHKTAPPKTSQPKTSQPTTPPPTTAPRITAPPTTAPPTTPQPNTSQPKTSQPKTPPPTTAPPTTAPHATPIHTTKTIPTPELTTTMIATTNLTNSTIIQKPVTNGPTASPSNAKRYRRDVDMIQHDDEGLVDDDTNTHDINCMEVCNITMNEATTVPELTTTTEIPTTTTPRHRSIDLSGKSVVLQLVIVVNDTFTSYLHNKSSSAYRTLANQYKTALTAFYRDLLLRKFKKIDHVDILGFSKGSIKCNYSLEITAPTNESEANSTVKELRDVKWKKDSLMNLTIDVNKTIAVQKDLLANDTCVLPINVCAHHEVLDWDKNGNPECKYKCDIPENKVYCGAHGECSFTYEGSIRCICKDGYSGELCKRPKSTTTTAKPIKPDTIALSKIDIIGIAGGIGGGLVLILLVALCCVYTKLNKAKKRDRFYGYMDNDKEFLHDENSRIENVPDLKNEYTNLGYQTEQNELQMQRFEPEGKNVEYEPGQRQGAYERDDKAYRKVEEPEGGNVLIYQPKHLNGPMERQSGASKFDEVEERSNTYRMMDTDTTYKIRRPTVNSDRNVPYN